MNRKVKTHYNRRSFIKSSTLGTGGLLLGFSWLAACKPDSRSFNEHTAAEPPSEWFEMNAFLKIGDTGLVTIVSPNPEIGQNVKTSMPMIVAEELGVNWNDVIVEQGALDTISFERQVAGGSQSIRKGWDSLRMAGATAREMLITAAASLWEVDAAKLTVMNGSVHSEDGKSLSFGELAGAASQLDVPEEVELKDPKDYTIIGKSKTNVEIDNILSGKPLFGIDYKVDGMKYATAVRPPAFGDKLESFDDSESKKVKGVEQVIQFGDKVAIIADSTWATIEGQKKLITNYISQSPEASEFHEEKLIELLKSKSIEPRRKDGDIDAAFSTADEIIERTYSAPFLPHNCLEPMNFFADVREDKVLLVGPIQTPEWCRSRVANILDRPEEDIQVELTRMGGGFGRRLYGDFSDEAAEISSLIGAPVKLQFTREDDMTAGTYRPASKYKIKAGLKNGEIVAYHLVEAAVNSNMYGLIPHFFPAGAIKNYQVDTFKYDSNITTGAWRAPYTNFLAFAEQSFFDEVAEKLGKDPVQLRLELLDKAVSMADQDENIEYSPRRMQGTIRLAAEKANWEAQDSDNHLGVSAYYSHNTHVAEIAVIKMINEAPHLEKIICAVDCGIVINPDAATNQIEGGIIDGIGHAMYGDLKFENGKPQSQNFHNYRLIRINEAPEIEVHFVDSMESPTGLGEPSLPPAGGAIANALYKATGKRLYSQPFAKDEKIFG